MANLLNCCVFNAQWPRIWEPCGISLVEKKRGGPQIELKVNLTLSDCITAPPSLLPHSAAGWQAMAVFCVWLCMSGQLVTANRLWGQCPQGAYYFFCFFWHVMVCDKACKNCNTLCSLCMSWVAWASSNESLFANGSIVLMITNYFSNFQPQEPIEPALHKVKLSLVITDYI